MATYITLINYTEQGVKNAKGIPDRVRAARQALENAGGRLHAYRLTLGEYDAVVTVEAPDDETYATAPRLVTGNPFRKEHNFLSSPLERAVFRT